MNLSVEDMQHRVAAELSLPSRLGHTALLVMSLSGAALVASLWLTEPALPPRTHAAFAAIVAMALAWAAFAGWVLARRRVLYAYHRVVSGRLAVAITALVLLGAVMLRDRTGTAGVVTAASFFAVACVVLVRSQRRFAALRARRDELQHQAAAGR